MHDANDESGALDQLDSALQEAQLDDPFVRIVIGTYIDDLVEERRKLPDELLSVSDERIDAMAFDVAAICRHRVRADAEQVGRWMEAVAHDEVLDERDTT